MNLQLYDAQGPISSLQHPTAVTIGVFDGVHLGHRHLISTLGAVQDTMPMPVVLTHHPAFMLGRRKDEGWIVERDEQLRLLFDAGAHYVALLDFDRQAATLTACQMARLLRADYRMAHLLVGYDSRFGNRSADDFDLLPSLAASEGFTLQVGEPLCVGEAPVSSSRIRRCIAAGDMQQAAALLGYAYSLKGPVVHGRGVGHRLGFPTANVSLDATRKLIPQEGVYAVRLNGMAAVANLGPQPTFGLDRPTLEVHIPDYEADLYGLTVQVEFIARLRDIRPFGSTDELRAQLQSDIAQAKQWS